MAKKINYSAVFGFTALYVATTFLCAFIGFLHPACWVFFPALAAFLGAFSYYKVNTQMLGFGVGIILSCALACFLLILGEIQWQETGIMVTSGTLSDIVRQYVGNRTSKGGNLAYPILSLGVIGWIHRLWTHTQWYYEGAVEEMGADYAEQLMKMGTPYCLCLVIVLTLVMSCIGLRLARKCMKSNLK